MSLTREQLYRRYSIAEIIMSGNTTVRIPTPIHAYGRCPQCRNRLMPDSELAEILTCTACEYFEPCAAPIKPSVEEL